MDNCIAPTSRFPQRGYVQNVPRILKIVPHYRVA